MKNTITTEKTFEERAADLARYGRTVCASALLFSNGTIKRASDCEFLEKLQAVAIYKYGSATVYKL